MPREDQPILESRRLLLRKFELSDANTIQILAGDNRVAKETMNIPHPYEDGMAENWISSLDAKWKNSKEAIFAIVVRENEEVIGSVGFVEIGPDVGEIGYWIGFPYWGNGYCAEAASCLLSFGKEKLSFTKMTGRHLASNPASGKILRKLGMDAIESIYCKNRYGELVKFELYETPSI